MNCTIPFPWRARIRRRLKQWLRPVPVLWAAVVIAIAALGVILAVETAHDGPTREQRIEAKIDSLLVRMARLEAAVDSLRSTLDDTTGYLEVTGSYYQATAEQCDADPEILADLTRVNPARAGRLRYVALSRDLLTEFGGGPFTLGDYVAVHNAGHKDGTYQVRDVMHERWRRRLDFLESTGRIEPYLFTAVRLRLARRPA